MTTPPSQASSSATWSAFAGCCLIWGSTFLVISIGNDALPPLWALALRMALAAVLLTAIGTLARHPLPRGAALRHAAGYGALNMGASMSLLYWAETRVPSGLVAVLYATIPLSTALFARLMGLERLSPLKIVGALVALGGVAAIFAGELSGAAAPLPLVAAVVAATLAALSGVVLKRGPRQSPLGANAVGSAVGGVIALLGSLAAREPHALPWSGPALLPVLYLVAAGSIGAFGLFAWLVNHWPVTRISFIAVVIPVVALTLGVTVRGERLTGAGAAGSALVMGGLGLALASDRLATRPAVSTARAPGDRPA